MGQVNSVLDFWFPHFTCLACQAEIPSAHNVYFCAACLAKLPAAPVTTTHYAAFGYAEPIRSLLLNLKHGHNLLVARALAPYLAAVYLKFVPPADHIIVPVPLHQGRLRERGYNQSAVLAHELATYLHLPVLENVLVRPKKTVMQKHLTTTQRASNVKDAFAVTDARQITDRDILLLDDVYTSGATTHECARVLQQHGARSVTILTVATAGQ